MIAYPTQLPIPTINYDGQRSSGVISNQTDAGPYIQRRRFKGRRKVVSVNWNFSYLEMGLFEHWFEELLHAGSSGFAMFLPDPSSRQLASTACQFMGGEYSFSLLAGQLKWRVTATLVLSNYNIMDNPTYEALLASAQVQEFIQNCPIAFESTGVRVVEENESFTLEGKHAGAVVRVNSPLDLQITCPKAAAPEDELGSAFNCVIVRAGTGGVEFIAEDNNVTVDSDGTRIFNQHAVAAVHFVDTNRYLIYGQLF